MQTINIDISREKFSTELQNFKKGAVVQRKRGILLLEAEFPDMIFSFSYVKSRPARTIFAVRINFDNYNFEPLSVRIVDSFSWEDEPSPLTVFNRKVGQIENQIQLQQLLLKDETGLPFLCLPGIREYHNHPAHSGDHWLTHRGKSGVGTLGFILEQLYTYGILAIKPTVININIDNIPFTYDLNIIPP